MRFPALLAAALALPGALLRSKLAAKAGQAGLPIKLRENPDAVARRPGR